MDAADQRLLSAYAESYGQIREAIRLFRLGQAPVDLLDQMAETADQRLAEAREPVRKAPRMNGDETAAVFADGPVRVDAFDVDQVQKLDRLVAAGRATRTADPSAPEYVYEPVPD